MAAVAEVDPSQWAAIDHMPLNDDTKPMLMGAMNGRYKGALNVYAKHFCSKANVVSAQLVDLDFTKLVLRYWDSEAQLEERPINYQNSAGDAVRASKAGDVRRILLEMARIAAAATGEELDLPYEVFCSMRTSDKVPGAYLLNDFIDLGTLECLNQDDEHPVTNAIRNSPSDAEGAAAAALQSDPDVDQQLLIKLGFRQPVKLKAIAFRAASEDETAPQLVKVFQGQMSIGFQEAEDQEATQTLELSASSVDECEPITLRFVKFQQVTTLQLFVQSNYGAEVTRISQVEFWGNLAEIVDMKSWKPVRKDASNPINPIVESAMDEPTGI